MTMFVTAEKHQALLEVHAFCRGRVSIIDRADGALFRCPGCGIEWMMNHVELQRHWQMRDAEPTMAQELLMSTAEEHRKILISHGDCSGAIITRREPSWYQHRCTGCKMEWKTSFEEFERHRQMYETRAFPETPTLEQLIRAERSKRDGLQKRYERFEAIVMRDLPFVGGMVDDLLQRVRGLEAVVEVLATGNLEEDLVRAEERYVAPCPGPYIGKPPHCGDPTCNLRHDPPAENTDLGEAGEAPVPKPRFFTRSISNGIFVYDGELHGGEQAVAAFWFDGVPVEMAKRWAEDLVAALNRASS